MEGENVDDYLEEKLFGSKEPVSSMLLSFELGQTLTEAARALQSFYDSHKDALDASFKVRTEDDARICIKVVSAKDFDTNGSEKGQIWIVSPQGAADRAVIANVSTKVQQLQCGLSIGRLKYLGVATNPLLESDFTISEGASKTSHSQKMIPKEPPSPTVKAPASKEATPQPSNVPNNEPANEPKPASNKPEPAPKRAKTEETKKKSETPKPRQSSKSGSSFFTKTNKADALKSMHKKSPESKPVHEAVVMSDVPNDQAVDDVSDTDMVTNVSKEEQLQKLKESMFKEESSEEDDILDRDEELGDHMDIDAGPDETETRTDAEMDDGPIEPHDDEPDHTSQAPRDEITREASAELSLDNKPDRTVNASKSPQRPQTRRVRKIVVRKDEEGFDVHEEVWEDVPVDSGEEEPETLAKQQKEPQAKKESEAKPESEAKKTAKAPPKLPTGPKKQKTLMSFFGKK